VLVVSSSLPELLGLCDRIAVMSRGRLGEAQPAAKWTQESLLAVALQLEDQRAEDRVAAGAGAEASP
jgi:ribose transport system ATP-binding protein